MTKTEIDYLPLETYLKAYPEDCHAALKHAYANTERIFLNGDDTWLFACELENKLSGNSISHTLDDAYFDFFDQLSVRYSLECIDGLENAAYALCHAGTLSACFGEYGKKTAEMLCAYALMRGVVEPMVKHDPELDSEMLYPIYLRIFKKQFASLVQLEHANTVYPYLSDSEAFLFVDGEAGDDLYDQVQIMQEELCVRYPDFPIMPDLSGLVFPQEWSETTRAIFSGKIHKLVHRID